MLERALQLTLAVYRVTKLFPEGEVLIGQIRQIANLILAEAILGHKPEAANYIRVMLDFLKITQAQTWTKPINSVILTKEYQKLLDELEKADNIKKKSKKTRLKKLSSRQKNLLGHIEKFNKVKAGDLVKFCPGLSRRTINRDLEELSLASYLKKTGQGRGIFYKKNLPNNLAR